jgi:hypothetical protein
VPKQPTKQERQASELAWRFVKATFSRAVLLKRETDSGFRIYEAVAIENRIAGPDPIAEDAAKS